MKEDRQPLEVKLVNAGEVGADKVFVVKRGDDGKMSGAVIQKIS